MRLATPISQLPRGRGALTIGHVMGTGPWKNVRGAYVASIEELGVRDLGRMLSGNEVDDCQSDKVGLSYGGAAMTNARWPNADPGSETAPWRWARAMGGCTSALGQSSFTMETEPAASRLLKWQGESEPFVHGYWEWDWGDSYAPVSRIRRHGGGVSLTYRGAPTCKQGARWMGVNLLSELDAPRELWAPPTLTTHALAAAG